MALQETSLRMQMAGCQFLHESMWPRRLLIGSGVGMVAIISANMYTSAKSGHSMFDVTSLFCSIGKAPDLVISDPLAEAIRDRAARSSEVGGVVGILAGFAPAAHCAVVPLTEVPGAIIATQNFHLDELELNEPLCTSTEKLLEV